MSLAGDMDEGVEYTLPLDVFPVIFRHLSQGTLCTCLRVCTAFRDIITGDEVLIARLQVVNSFEQLKRYMEVGRHYYCVEYYTEIGQNDMAKFPYYREYVVDKLTHRDKPEMHLHFSSPSEGKEKKPSVTGSMLFSKEITERNYDIFCINKFDLMLKLLQRLWGFVNDPDNKSGIISQLPFLDRNIRKAVKNLKRHMKENEKFGEFAMLQAGHTNWFKSVMKLKPEEEPETSSDEELTQEMGKEDIGKVPVYYCKKCRWRVGGFTCRTVKEGEEMPCGDVLVVQHDGSLRCPKGCGVMSVPRCCRKWAMKAQVDSKYIIGPGVSDSVEVRNESCPVFSCAMCGFGVDSIRCFTCTDTGCDVKRNGFFERVWCAYVWTCPKGCGRRDRGGLTHGGFIQCQCQGDKDTPLVEHSYVAKFGPPQN